MIEEEASVKNIRSLRWENIVTDEQEERLERAIVKQFQSLIDFLKGDPALTSLFAQEKQAGGRAKTIGVSGQKHTIDVAVEWGDRGPEFQYECNGSLLEWDGGWQLTEQLRDGGFYPSDIHETKKRLETLRQKLLNKSRGHLGRSGGLEAAIKEFHDLKKHPRLKNIRFFGIDIKGVNGSVNIDNTGRLSWPAPCFMCEIKQGNVGKFFEMYGISRADIDRVRQMIDA